METALSLGILGVALTAILGVLSTAMFTSSSNDRDSVVVAMSEGLMAELRLAPFDSLWLEDPMAASSSVAGPVLPSGLPTDSVYSFDEEGKRLPSGASSAQASYVCIVKKEADTPPLGAPATPCHLMKLRLIFQWPPSAPERSRTTRIISTRIARR